MSGAGRGALVVSSPDLATERELGLDRRETESRPESNDTRGASFGVAGVGLSRQSGRATCGDHPGAPTTPSDSALDPQSNLLRGRGAESSVDDFDAARGVVPSRAAASLRSIESHPRELRFVSARAPRLGARGVLPTLLPVERHRRQRAEGLEFAPSLAGRKGAKSSSIRPRRAPSLVLKWGVPRSDVLRRGSQPVSE
ncbi:Hypp9597 [Branchiostoma lanceolatum]|uniref:Hypp9597 protein n=1 Tax=Branchiostoma lanceolatum TaxID=7740 RepID=A0A8S4MND7_BRALA|nr:Hypp9597 [Branchiostoma lanceolatum]